MPAAAPSPQWASPRNVDTSPLEEDGNGRNTPKLRVSQAELAGSYEALYSRLNPRAGVKAAARRANGQSAYGTSRSPHCVQPLVEKTGSAPPIWGRLIALFSWALALIPT